MKKVLLDECIPRKFKNYLPGYETVTVPEAGMAGRKNGDLLSFAEDSGFQIFLPLDRGIEYEQNLITRNFAVVLISAKSSRLSDLLPQVPQILSVLGSIEAGQLVHVP